MWNVYPRMICHKSLFAYLLAGWRSLITFSSKGRPPIFKANHGRSDQDEYRLVPITRTRLGMKVPPVTLKRG